MRRNSRGFHAVWIGLLAAALLLQIGPSHGGGRQFDPARAIEPFDLPLLGGGRQSVDDFEGRPVLLSLWATWCAPCRQELPAFEKARDELGADHPDAVFMTINIGDGGGRAGSFMKKAGLDLPVLLAGQNFIYDYGIQIIPTIMVLNREGKLTALHEGWTPGTDLTAELGRDLRGLDGSAGKESAR